MQELISSDLGWWWESGLTTNEQRFTQIKEYVNGFIGERVVTPLSDRARMLLSVAYTGLGIPFLIHRYPYTDDGYSHLVKDISPTTYFAYGGEPSEHLNRKQFRAKQVGCNFQVLAEYPTFSASDFIRFYSDMEPNFDLLLTPKHINRED